MPETRAKVVWKAVALNGIVLLVIGLGAIGLDFLTTGDELGLSQYIEVFLLAILAGAVSLPVGLIGGPRIQANVNGGVWQP